jgi:hypothetical protein
MGFNSHSSGTCHSVPIGIQFAPSWFQEYNTTSCLAGQYSDTISRRACFMVIVRVLTAPGPDDMVTTYSSRRFLLCVRLGTCALKAFWNVSQFLSQIPLKVRLAGRTRELSPDFRPVCRSIRDQTTHKPLLRGHWNHNAL